MKRGQTFRIHPLRECLKAKSHFLLGPHQIGKSTLIRQALGDDCVYYDLLDTQVAAELTTRPWLIRERLRPQDKLIVIDEVQKLPALLDEVQLLVERDADLRFLLTGPSGRKLKRGGANLLGGRLWTTYLYPFVAPELDYRHWEERLRIGSMPSVLFADDPMRELQAYAGRYLQEEVRAEGLVRSIENFSRFLATVAHTNGEQVNFTNIGSDASVPSRTVREFYRILVDTLIGFYLEPWRHGKRKAVATPKFYFFDVGIANSMVGRRELARGTAEYGRAFEHQVILEVRAYLTYKRVTGRPLTYWRTKEQHEVDLVIGDEIAIEIKAKPAVTDRDLKSMRLIAGEAAWQRRIVVSEERAWRRTEDGIEVWPVEEFLRMMWDGGLIT